MPVPRCQTSAHALLLGLALGCASGRQAPPPAPARPAAAADSATTPRLRDSTHAVARPAKPGADTSAGHETRAAGADSAHPVAPPDMAYAHGWMPLASTGVDRFLRAHPEFDGRGVLIGILDTGIDPAVPGLRTTSTGGPKILDLRDFSGEGAVPLERVTPAGDTVAVAGRRLAGAGRLRALSTAGPYYGGTIAELPLGEAPAADLDGNGTVGDTLPVLVVKATDGWVLLADTDGDGSLAGEKPIHDYLVGRETFGWAGRGSAPRVTVAANFTDSASTPRLDLVFDTGAHGTHVAGIAAGHDL
ncbi:MAG TPA: S8 family serine peptidase, partial [Gemmatimonadales bacterium]|nr:S8 family serine peptidase [Gemmatimonadales bacterium]